MKLIINTIALTLFLVITGASAEVSKPYGAFNPLAMFDLEPRIHKQKADSAFYNYGNKGYDFVVEAILPVLSVRSRQIASLKK